MSQRHVILAVENGKLRHDKANTTLGINGLLKKSVQASSEVVSEQSEVLVTLEEVVVEEPKQVVEVPQEETQKDSLCVQQEVVEEQHDESFKKEKKSKRVKKEN